MKGETTTMPTYEGLRLKALKIRRKTFAAQRKKAIKDTILQLFLIIVGEVCYMRAMIFQRSLQQLGYL